MNFVANLSSATEHGTTKPTYLGPRVDVFGGTCEGCEDDEGSEPLGTKESKIPLPGP